MNSLYFFTDSLKTCLQSRYTNLVVAKINLPNQPKDSASSCSNSCPDCTCRANKTDQSNAMKTDEVVNIKPVSYYLNS